LKRVKNASVLCQITKSPHSLQDCGVHPNGMTCMHGHACMDMHTWTSKISNLAALTLLDHHFSRASGENEMESVRDACIKKFWLRSQKKFFHHFTESRRCHQWMLVLLWEPNQWRWVAPKLQAQHGSGCIRMQEFLCFWFCPTQQHC